MLTTSELGALLAAVCNHEAKALTCVAMEPGEAYGVSALHRLFLDIQGDDPVFVGTVNLQQKYCLYSFEPAGLVYRAKNDKGRLRHVRADPGGLATALAGHLLSVIEHHDASLAQIFAKIAAPDSDGPGSERPPIRRFAVLEAMATGPRSAHTADVSQRRGIGDLTVGHIAAALAKAGMLGYRTEPTYRMKSSYRIDRPVPVPTGRNSRPLTNAVVDCINTRLADNSEDAAVVSRDEIESHLRAQPRWTETAGLRDVLQRVMVRLTERGQLTPVRDFTGQGQHSVISVDDHQREFLRTLTAGIEVIAAHDRQAIEHGQDRAMEIINSPVRVRRLMAKAFGTSKLVVNPISEADKQARVLAVLRDHAGVTTEDITTRLSPDLNTPLVRCTLSQLAKDGHVRGEKQPDGPYKRWYLT